MIWSALRGDTQLTHGMNIPSRGEVGAKARRIFVARPGHKLIVADYNQMELRMLAHYSEDPVLMQAFIEERDLHLVTAAAPARTTYEDLKARYETSDQWAKDMRQIGKTMNFALNYGMGPKKFRRFLLVNNKYEVTEEQAEEWIHAYNEMYAGCTQWKEEQRREVAAYGYVRTIANRKRRLPDALVSHSMRIRSRAQRQGVNAKIQGSCGDIICKAMVLIQPAIEPLGGTLLLQVHDELVAEAPEETAQEVACIIERLMVEFINPYLRVPMVANAHVGNSWGEAKG